MIYKIRDWIDESALDDRLYNNPTKIAIKEYNKYSGLSFNIHPAALEILKQNPDKIHWRILSSNYTDDVICFLRKHPDKVDLYSLSINNNPKALILLKDILHSLKPKKNYNIIKIIFNLFYDYDNELNFKIRLNTINWHSISRNNSPEAIELLKLYPDKISWYDLSCNETKEAVELLRQNINKIHWDNLTRNTADSAIELLLENTNKIINWKQLSSNTNPKAVAFLRKNPDKINWSNLSYNKLDEAVEILKQNLNKIDWVQLSANINPNAIDLLKQHPDKIDWYNLSGNNSDESVKLLRQYPEKIKWSNLSGNNSNEAIELLKYNLDKINRYILVGNTNVKVMDILNIYTNKDDLNILFRLEINTNYSEWDISKQNSNSIIMNALENIMHIHKVNYHFLYKHPDIFVLDYDKLKERIAVFKEELIQRTNSPVRIQRLLDAGIELEDIDGYL